MRVCRGFGLLTMFATCILDSSVRSENSAAVVHCNGLFVACKAIREVYLKTEEAISYLQVKQPSLDLGGLRARGLFGRNCEGWDAGNVYSCILEV